MNLALYRREQLEGRDLGRVGAATADQFQRTHGALMAWSEVEHTEDGRHSDITADSIDVGALVANSLTIDGPVTVNGGPLAVSGPITVNGPITVGSVIESPRTVPMGYWAATPFNAAHFSADAGTWLVAAGNVLANRYTLIGKTLHWNLVLSGTSLSIAAGVLSIRLPFAATAGAITYNAVGQLYNAGTWGIPTMAFANQGDTSISVRRQNLTNFVAGQIELYMTFVIEML